MNPPSACAIALLICVGQLLPVSNTLATQNDIIGPLGSSAFGATVVALPNGNFVVIDPYGGIAGRVHLYNGETFALINTMTGTDSFDFIGNGGITVLANGDYVVNSHNWNNNRGAVTRCSATTGCPGIVSAENSLVGSATHDTVGSTGITALSNGSYVVLSVLWSNYTGAITWCDGATGCVGEVSPANSRVGMGPGAALVVLSNGNYVVGDPLWSGTASDAGAVTFCSGAAPCTGSVSVSNSLVGSRTNEFIGDRVAIFPLANGNYVVSTKFFLDGQEVGAVTFCNGMTGCHETVGSTNSLFGKATDGVGYGGVTALTNGDYVVLSPYWDNGGTLDVGAATYCNGATGCVGMTVSATNSLVGMTMNDDVGYGKVIALTDGKYVVDSPYWDNPATAKVDVGASTFCGDPTSCIGVVSTNNSLIGTSPNDRVGYSGVALTNGNYVVVSSQWNNTRPIASSAGAVTFCDGKIGCLGEVTSANSLVGSSSNDNVGMVTALANGNYVVSSSTWDNGAIPDVGAATFCNGTSGCRGEVSAANSLIGSTPYDGISGPMPALALAGGNYVVISPNWDNGAATDAGALTPCSGLSGCTGTVSATNSLVGSTANDRIGGTRTANSFYGDTTALPNGDYVLRTFAWDNGGIHDAGAVTYGFGNGGTIGPITRRNSVLGTEANEGGSLNFSLQPGRNRILVGRPDHNTVTVFTPDGAPEAIGAVSRKVQGASGPFDIDVLHSQVECRTGTSTGRYQVLVTFADPVSVGGVSVTSSDGKSTATQSVNGTVVAVDLAMVTNAQTVRINLLQVNDGVGTGDVVVPFKVLIGDSTGDGFVTSIDVNTEKINVGQPVNTSTFRYDVTSDGSITASDLALVKSKSGTSVP